jgi:hypothetical protein
MVFGKLLYKILSANDDAADMFRIEFQKFVQEQNLNHDQIYNADESC